MSMDMDFDLEAMEGLMGVNFGRDREFDGGDDVVQEFDGGDVVQQMYSKY
jgi:hypothetical protein